MRLLKNFMGGLFQHESTDPSTAATNAVRRALTGLNPLGLMDAVLSENSMDWHPPETSELEALMEEYEAFTYIDRGGMGAVYAATQKSLSRRVAIKVLPAELGSDKEFVRLFEREGRMLGQLQHPHIVTVYGSGRTKAGHLYIVMEYVEGTTLFEQLRRQRPAVTKALEITAQICEALDYAHERGVIHLDIKPGNILIDKRGFVRVADFGLARDLKKFNESSPSAKSLSEFAGTFGYSAPEQRRKEGMVDHRADIYSLGVTLYEMLAGRVPSGMSEPPSKRAGTPAHLDRIVQRAMNEAPGDRYQSAMEMRSAIARSMLRLGTPLVQRAIISRPIISMVTSVIVGMGFIYLLDALNKQPPIRQLFAANAQSLDARDAAQLALPAPLNEKWAVIRQNLSWDHLTSRLDQFPQWQIAEIRTPEEQREVAQLLHDQHYTHPLWLGATFDESAVEKGFQWLSGKPMNFSAWMSPETPPAVVITEVEALNKGTFKTKDGETPDWIEIHNPTAAPIDLRGYHLRHYFGGENLAEGWVSRNSAPSEISMVMQPGEYRIIACSPRLTNASGCTHISMNLDARAGRLEWVGPQGWIVQRFDHNWTNFPPNASIGIAPTGKGWGWCQSPTPGRENSSLTKPFPGPVASAPIRPRIMMLPEFNAEWARSPASVPRQTLLRRIRD